MAALDVEDENILASIFKDAFPDSWQDNPDFVQYLVELSSFGVDRLSREPERLAEEKAQILSETQDLAFHNYTTFIQTADCSKEIFEDFQIIEKHVDNLLTKLPPFATECDKVVKKAHEISSSRRMNTLTLQRHTQLLEVLEMPQLMDTCVRNGYYEEALELAAHVKRLEKKHSGIPVIMSIVEEVKGSTQLMLNQLIQQLRTNLQLPACLRVIGFLRRMDVFTEAELRIKFLQARDSWFQTILESIPKGDAYIHITKTIEASRVHLFDIITQYRAIFSDEDPLLSTSRDETINESSLFHGWVVQKVSQFLATLESDLHLGVGGRLDSLLGQCMYFGLSFSRVGADFRGLLAPIFKRAALQNFKSAVTDANKRFEENMQSYHLLGVSSTSSSLGYGMASQPGSLYPPTVLLDFYPLAAYCNHVLSAFNELRLCSPINLACEVAACLERSLLEVNRIILAFFRAEETTFNTKEEEQFGQFCATYVTDLLPYINKCLQTLYPPAQLALVLGLSVPELNKLGNIGQVDLKLIMKQISHLIPVVKEITKPAVTQATDETSQTPVSPTVKTEITPDYSATSAPVQDGLSDQDTTCVSTDIKDTSTSDNTANNDSNTGGPTTNKNSNTVGPTTDKDSNTTGLTTGNEESNPTGIATLSEASKSDSVSQNQATTVSTTSSESVVKSDHLLDSASSLATGDAWGKSWADSDFSIDLDAVELPQEQPPAIDLNLASSVLDSVLHGKQTEDVKKQD